MRTLGIIPARAGSQRIPGKNWKPLAGRPLADYIMAAAAQATSLAEVVVTSDSEEVLALAHCYPNFHRILRPAALSTSTSPSITYVQHTLAHLAEAGLPPFDAIAVLQPTSPFTLPADIDATIRLLAESDADSAVSITQIPHDLNPLKMKVFGAAGELLPYFEPEAGRMAAHEVPQVYIRNGAVYVSRLATIESGVIIGKDCRGYVVPRERSVDLNDSFDWLLAEFMLAKFSDKLL